MKNKIRLKKDLVIPKGTIFENCDGEKLKFVNGNYTCSIGLTKDSCGRLIYGYENLDKELHEWFEEV